MEIKRINHYLNNQFYQIFTIGVAIGIYFKRIESDAKGSFELRHVPKKG